MISLEGDRLLEEIIAWIKRASEREGLCPVCRRSKNRHRSDCVVARVMEYLEREW